MVVVSYAKHTEDAMRACLALILFSVSSIGLAADAYPTKPIRMILPVAPSGVPS
jgi:hypothetical protein